MRFINAQLLKAVFMMSMINLAIAIENVLFKKMLDDGVNRMVATTYRLTVGTLFLTPFAVFLERKNRPQLTANILGLLFLSALLGTSLGQYFFLLGLQYTSSTFALAFTNMVPAVTFALALILRQEKVNIKNIAGQAKVIGTIISIGGALVLTFYKGTPLTHNAKSQTQMKNPSTTSHNWGVGSVMLIISVAIWSSWFIIHAKISRKYTCQYTSTTILSSFGVIQSALLSFISQRSTSMWIITKKSHILSITYAGAAVGLCCVGMSWCLQQRGPVFTSSFIPLIQVFASILSLAFFHEQIYWGSVIGSVVVVTGLYILLWGKSKESFESVTIQDELDNNNEVLQRVSKEPSSSTANSTSNKN